MKLIARITAALALLAIATPALPCGGAQQTTATNDAKKAQPVAKADARKAPKTEKKAATVKVAKPAPETRTATAQ